MGQVTMGTNHITNIYIYIYILVHICILNAPQRNCSSVAASEAMQEHSGENFQLNEGCPPITTSLHAAPSKPTDREPGYHKDFPPHSPATDVSNTKSSDELEFGGCL